MNRITIFIAIIVIFFTACAKNPSKDVMHLHIDNPEDATLEIYNALLKCKEEGYSKLILEKGTYHLRRTRAFEKYVAVSNCDNGLKRISFPISGFKDFEFDGGGSMFICHGHMLPFQVEDSENIILGNFKVDWHTPFFLQAEVLAVHPEDNSYDIGIHPECAVRLVNNELLFYDPEMVRTEDRWFQDMNWNEWFDPQTGGVVFGGKLAYPRPGRPGFSVSHLGGRKYRLSNASAELPQAGWILVCKGARNFNMTNRSSSVIHINRCNNVLTKNVTIHHASGIGFVAERSSDIFIDSMQVILPPGKGRYVTTTADATHFVYCRGRVEITNSYFENMLDDATNIHGNYTSVLDVIDSHTIGVEMTHQHQLDVEIAGPGDRMRIVDQEFTPLGSLTVKSVDKRNSVYVIIEFEEEVESLIKKGGYWLENLTWNAEVFKFENSTVKNNRARSVLVSSLNKVIIQGCTFINPSMDAIRMAEISKNWATSGPVMDVLIQNNDFYLYHSHPAIQVNPLLIPCNSVPEYFYNENVRILKNRFHFNSPNPVILITHTDGLEFSENEISFDINNNKPDTFFDMQLSCTRNVKFSLNETTGAGLKVRTLFSSDSVKQQENTGFLFE